jgi:hypothetical protein
MALSPRNSHLVRGDGVAGLDFAEHARQTRLSEAALIEQSAVMIDAGASAGLRVGVTDGEFLGQLRVGDQVLPV